MTVHEFKILTRELKEINKGIKRLIELAEGEPVKEIAAAIMRLAKTDQHTEFLDELEEDE